MILPQNEEGYHWSSTHKTWAPHTKMSNKNRDNVDDDLLGDYMVLQKFHYSMPIISIKNGMWWKIHRGAYPNLHLMAVDFTARSTVPLMSV